MRTLDLRFTRRDCLIALVIILLAFVYRVQIIWDRANAPNGVSVFDPIPSGIDQYVYYSSISQFKAGTFPPPTYFYQPGPSWFMVWASALLCTDNPGALRVLVAALGSLNCGVMIALTRLAFGKRWVGILAGLLLALYPVSAFYDTDFVITSQATILVTIVLLGILWTLHSPRNWTGAVLVGLSVGTLLLMRRELATLGLVLGLWLLWRRRDWKVVFQLGLSAMIVIGVILPTALHNRAGGATYLITPVSSAELYRGNNRDTNGSFGGKQASASTHTDYEYFLWQDILLSPQRFIELELHKIGLYLSSSEPGNNLNYVISGKSISSALKANPLNFTILLMLFLFGTYALIREREKTLILFALSFITMLGVTLLIWVEARIRTPVIVCMIPVVAYGIVWFMEHFPLRIRRQNQLNLQIIPGTLGLLLLPIPFIAGVQLFSDWGAYTLPRPVTVTELPNIALPYHAVYDQTLELVGWKIEEQYSPVGIIEPQRPYVVTFYWRSLAPTSIDYSFSLAYMIDGEKVIGFDHPIGAVSDPETPTSQWQPGEIHVEHVGITWKSTDGPLGINGNLLLYVYPDREAERLLSAKGVAGEPITVQIAQPAIMLGVGKPATLTERETPGTFGDELILKAWSLPERATTGESIPITLGWQTTSRQISRSYSFGIYAFSSTGEFVAQSDGPPHDGRLLTFSLPVNYYFEDTKQMVMPNTPDTYTLFVGVYDNATMERLPLLGTSNNLFRIGEVRVSGR